MIDIRYIDSRAAKKSFGINPPSTVTCQPRRWRAIVRACPRLPLLRHSSYNDQPVRP